MNVGVGLHLNIVEGTSKRDIDFNRSLLCNRRGEFKSGFIRLLLNSWKPDFLREVEEEFRSQIQSYITDFGKPDHINSHQHSHAIPALFSLVCKLARENKVEFVRNPNEILYWPSPIAKNFSRKLPANFIKQIVLKICSLFNKPTLKAHSLRSSDYFIGVLFTGAMSKSALKKGLSILTKAALTAPLLKPCFTRLK